TYIIRNQNRDFIGVIGLHVFDNNNDVASIGYWVDSRYTCKGYCSDAVQLLVQNAIPQLNLIRVEIIVALNNHASQRVAEKAGASFEAVLKNRIRIRGLPVDAKVFAFTNPA
ncbi:MAG: GNAT family N-acetyltransferase, partial [Xanthomonadales bacterium]|nr:GNAT family N-acetyltransferase [Xanthomonadales bacterium]